VGDLKLADNCAVSLLFVLVLEDFNMSGSDHEPALCRRSDRLREDFGVE